jgi:hypothetical protein
MLGEWNTRWGGSCFVSLIILVDSNNRIRPQDYYCVDVIEEAIDEGRRQFPEAHWVHYNRYNCSFNPEGTVDLLIPELGVQFDFIVAYSVFTHIARGEMHDLPGQLRPVSSRGERLLSPSSTRITRAGQQPTLATTFGGDWNRPVEPKPRSMSPAFSRRLAARPGAPWWTGPNFMSRAAASTACDRS